MPATEPDNSRSDKTALELLDSILSRSRADVPHAHHEERGNPIEWCERCKLEHDIVILRAAIGHLEARTELADQQLKEIEDRANAATPGPWTVNENTGHYSIDEEDSGCDIPGCSVDEALIINVGDFDMMSKDNATFIAHARQDIPFLLSAIRALEARAAQADQKLATARADALKEAADKMQLLQCAARRHAQSEPHQSSFTIIADTYKTAESVIRAMKEAK